MKTNKEVVVAFSHGLCATGLNMTSTGDRLYSYVTVICERIGSIIILNRTSYSHSIGRQQAIVCMNVNYTHITQARVPRGTVCDLLRFCNMSENEIRSIYIRNGKRL